MNGVNALDLFSHLTPLGDYLEGLVNLSDKEIFYHKAMLLRKAENFKVGDRIFLQSSVKKEVLIDLWRDEEGNLRLWHRGLPK